MLLEIVIYLLFVMALLVYVRIILSNLILLLAVYKMVFVMLLRNVLAKVLKCPSDSFAQLTDNIQCRPKDGDCDVVEKCDGSSCNYPASVFHKGNKCRDTFSGCFALTCGSCSKYFCVWCLCRCDDAKQCHVHAGSCKKGLDHISNKARVPWLSRKKKERRIEWVYQLVSSR